jgi:hypothetical protein
LSGVRGDGSRCDAFARRVYAITKARDFAGYEKLMEPLCHSSAVTSRSFELRANILSKLSQDASVEAMILILTPLDHRNNVSESKTRKRQKAHLAKGKKRP